MYDSYIIGIYLKNDVDKKPIILRLNDSQMDTFFDSMRRGEELGVRHRSKAGLIQWKEVCKVVIEGAD
jgi:hypothetical protein